MSSGRNEHLRLITEFAKEHGWSLERRCSGHFRLTHSQADYVTISGSPSCPNAAKQAVRDMIRKMREAKLPGYENNKGGGD